MKTLRYFTGTKERDESGSQEHHCGNELSWLSYGRIKEQMHKIKYCSAADGTKEKPFTEVQAASFQQKKEKESSGQRSVQKNGRKVESPRIPGDKKLPKLRPGRNHRRTGEIDPLRKNGAEADRIKRIPGPKKVFKIGATAGKQRGGNNAERVGTPFFCGKEIRCRRLR